MRKLDYGLLAGALALLAGCQATPDRIPSTPPAASPAASAAKPAATSAAALGPAPAGQPYTGYHRYRGTVGGRPVTMELTIGPESWNVPQTVCQGSYRYDRQAAGYLVLSSPKPYRLRQPLQLVETDTAHADRSTGRWQATQAAGPVLTGTWSSPAGKQLPFRLHEDYTDGQGHLMAVSYEVVGEETKVPCRPEREADETKAAYRTRIATYDNRYSQQFLHLLGADTLRPALLAIQCPVPAERRRQVRAAARADDGCNYHTATLAVGYNAYGLLAWNETWEDDFVTGARPAHAMSATVYDLRGGEVLTLADVLRPGTDTLVQRLITQHIVHGDSPDIEPTPGLAVPAHAEELAPLPVALFSLAEEGLAFGYEIDELARFTEGGTILCWVTVPYAELLPLLRPASPVARMLRERGLWRGK